jgi:hypothetical protein
MVHGESICPGNTWPNHLPKKYLKYINHHYITIIDLHLPGFVGFYLGGGNKPLVRCQWLISIPKVLEDFPQSEATTVVMSLFLFTPCAVDISTIP